MFPQKALDVRIDACCEQDQTLDLAKHLHHSVAGTQARFPLVSHFIDFTLRCVCGVVLLGQTECFVLSWWSKTRRSALRAGPMETGTDPATDFHLPITLLA